MMASRAYLKFVSIFFLVFLRSSCEAIPSDSIFRITPLGNNIYEGVFTGNGLLGTMTYLKGKNKVRIDLGRTDVYDHRMNDESALFDKARLPIGYFTLDFSEEVNKSRGEIDYGQAEAAAIYQVGEEELKVRTLTFAEKNIIYIEISGDKGKYSELAWQPEKAISPRMYFGHAKKPLHYPENPNGHHLKRSDINIFNQPLLAGGGYAVAYKKMDIAADRQAYIATISYNPSSSDYIEQAIDEIRSFSVDAFSETLKSHRKWWKNYYNKSSFSVPDTLLQSFYNMQLYKLACATRYDKPAIDLQGPWTSATPWPAYWHNLNIQLTYSPTFTANHLDIAHSLIGMIDTNVENLIRNVPEPYRYNSAAIGRSSAPDMVSPVYLQKDVDGQAWEDGKKELGNLTWMLHSYYQYYRYSMDKEVYAKLFPLLKRAVNYYIHLLEKDEHGKYHIAVKTYSPEYSKGYALDTNYDLSILKWGLKTLIALDNEEKGDDDLHTTWEDILNNLRPYPKDRTGYTIAEGISYDESHRHYSHLMMIYPFYDVHWDQKEKRDLIARSVAHWQSKKAYLQGYSFSGVSSMYSMMGQGDKALAALHNLLGRYVKPNTLYAETGPVIETPLAAMSSMQEMVLQYWNHTLRVFPSVPTAWNEVSFQNFLTDGAFLVSADRKTGKTTRIAIESQHSGNLTVKHGMEHPELRIEGRGAILEKNEHTVTLFLEKDAKAIFYCP